MWRLYSLPPSSGGLQHISVKVQPHQPLPLVRTRQSKIHYFIDAVVYGPVKLLWLVTGQHQHEPAGKKTQKSSCLETCWEGKMKRRARHIKGLGRSPSFVQNMNKCLLVALLSGAIQESIQGGSEVFTDLLLQNKKTSKDSTLCSLREAPKG